MAQGGEYPPLTSCRSTQSRLMAGEVLDQRWDGWLLRGYFPSRGDRRCGLRRSAAHGSGGLAKYVERRNELAEELVHEPVKIRFDVPVDVLAGLLDDLVSLAAEPRKSEEIA